VRWAAALAGIISALSLLGAVLIGRTIIKPIRILREGSASLIGGRRGVLKKAPSEIVALQDALEHAAAEQKRVQEELRASEQRYRASFDVAIVGKMEVDAKTGLFLLVNDAYCSIVGWPREALLRMRPADLTHPDDQPWDGPKVAAFLRGEVENYSAEKRIVRKNGETVWVRINCSLVRDSDGQPLHSVGVLDDISSRKKHEAQIELLMREVNHRSKNLLAVVQAIARHTAWNDPAEFMERFSERLRALSANQDLLIQNDWKGIDLDELARTQISHLPDTIGSQVIINGPSVRLSPAAAQSIGLALHELANNAVKHGALRNNTGAVTLEWAVDHESLRIDWIETGGLPVQPAKRRGFGSVIIAQMTKNTLEGTVDLQHLPEGTRWHLICPLQNAIERNAGQHSTVSRPSGRSAEVRKNAQSHEQLASAHI
jgi:PAS domain S-box-containing protein